MRVAQRRSGSCRRPWTSRSGGPISWPALGQLASPPRLLILDTLARCFGAGDENSTGDMGVFIASLDRLRADFPQLTILIVHHSGKDDTKGARGSTALKGAADAVMHLTKKGS